MTFIGKVILKDGGGRVAAATAAWLNPEEEPVVYGLLDHDGHGDRLTVAATHRCHVVRIEVLLRIRIERPLASRSAKVVGLALVGAVASGGFGVYVHSADGVFYGRRHPYRTDSTG